MAKTFVSLDDCFNVEANELTHENVEAVALWCGGVSVVEHDALDHNLTFFGINVPTSNGIKRAQEGDYIVRQLIGDFIVVKSYEFSKKYEAL